MFYFIIPVCFMSGQVFLIDQRMTVAREWFTRVASRVVAIDMQLVIPITVF